MERSIIDHCYVMQVYNATDEVANAANYPMIRLFTAQLQQSTTPVDELLGITEPWSVASPGWSASVLSCHDMLSKS